MKTLTRDFAKRALSLVLVLMMLMSLCIVGITSSAAAGVDLAETGASQTFAAGDYIYIKNFKPASNWTAYWFADDINEWVHLWNDSTGASFDAMFELIEGTANSADAVYGAKITNGGTFDHVIFTRAGGTDSPWDDERNRTGNIVLDGKNNCFTNMTVGGTSFTGSVYTPPVQGEFWVDLNPDDDTSDLDLLYPEKKNGNWYFYLPSYADAANLEFHVSEGATLKISGIDTPDGQVWNLASDVNGGAFPLSGDFSGNMYLKQSANVSAIHTTTGIDMPTTTGQYANKDDYETKGSIIMIDVDGNAKNSDTVLKKIKGRGNSSWKASNELIGKYAFNITLDAKAKLLDESSKSKKFCLVSYNADEARMRNMIVYELAQQIGVEYVADYEPVDLYNNGHYIGSYLLTDKVEIGDPLVEILELDGINEEWSENNTALYDDDSLMTRGYSGGSSINDNSTPGFYKYISNLDEPDASEYADSGFLLEFELNERFADEISGFISSKGQQIVCKYPEFATKNEMKFILDKWNAAEALMYNENATYEELDAVIDVESFARMYIIQELTKNLDGGATSFYVWYDGGKLHAGCAWDYDWTLGQYGNLYNDRINTGSDFEDQIDGDPNHTGGWYLNSKNIYGKTNVLNAQAALCQNDNFWGVVTAEWNEIVYAEAKKFVDSNVNSVSELDGIIKDYYDQVHASTLMDEAKWSIIANDPMLSWGSIDSGDTHDAATVYLNNWYFDRLEWMNKYIGVDGESHTGIYDVDYDIQPPMVSADQDSYQVGDTVTLTIEDKTGGNYTYTIYKDGVEVATTDDTTYTFTADKKGTADYTVVATSKTSQKASAESEAAAVNVEGFTLTLDVVAPETATVGDNITINASTNSDETVTYTLKDSNGTVDTNTTGKFTVAANTAGEFTYTVEATTTVDGEKYTASEEFTVTVSDFAFSVNLSAPTSVEAGMKISLKAETNSSAAVTYKFYDGSGNLIAENGTGLYSVEVLDSEIGTEKSFYVVATTTVAGKEYSKTSDTKTVSITAVKETYEVTIYFKSTSTLGYKPLISTDGAVEDLADKEMTKDIFISKNATQTASYYWYRADVQVSKASPALTVTVLSSRYAMEGNINLTITESGTIYLAVDNLNAGYEMLDLTDWDEDMRNWTKSAVHMVYDEDIDGKDSLAQVGALVNLTYVGDANDDGNVNIKDTTHIQKHLAGIITLDDLAAEISDVDSDGLVTIKDATAIQKKLVALL